MITQELSPKETARANFLLETVINNHFIPHEPTHKQAKYLLVPNLEAFYGGAAGGGKSDGLLMAALQFVDMSNYAAILFRRTYPDLKLPGALMDKAQEWLHDKAHWNEITKTWTFASGATLSFGYMQYETDKYRYQSAEFQFIGFDELTQFSQTQYEFLFLRLRRLADSKIPLRMRSASNPGGIGHLWVKSRFVNEATRDPKRVFVSAKLADNPHLDRESYMRGLQELDPITRQQMLDGIWIDRGPGDKFRREWFETVEALPTTLRRVRYWDMAATKKAKGKDPSYTVGTLVVEKDGIFYVADVVRMRGTPGEVERAIKFTAKRDGKDVAVGMEQEPGSSGITVISHFRRNVLPGYTVIGNRPTGSKELRANPFSSVAEAGNVKILEGRWNEEWLDEFEGFPSGQHDDQVDSTVGGYEILTGSGSQKAARVVIYDDPVSISPI